MKARLDVPDPRRCKLDHRHKHGVTARCYSAGGCRCQPCRMLRSGYRRREQRAMSLILGRDIDIPIGGTMRRLQALATRGYGSIEIAAALGKSARHVNAMRLGENPRVRVSNARAVAEFYRKHAMTFSTDPRASFVVAVAKRNGWVGPVVWADIDRGKRDSEGIDA